VLDLMMPVMNGWQFRTLQRKDPTLARIPVIAISASESPQAEAIDAQAFHRKPLDLDALLDSVRRLIAHDRAGALSHAESPLDPRLPAAPRDPARRLSDLSSHLHLVRAELPVMLDEYRRRLGARPEAAPGVARLEELVLHHLDSARRIETVARDLHLLAHAPAHEGPVSRARLLIIDDEDAITRSMERLLRRDHVVRALPSARQALELVQRERFDLILCDLHMPDFTGREFWEQVHELMPGQDHHIAFMTAGILNSGMMEFTRTVSCPVVEKPLLPEDVDQLLRHFATH